MSLQIWLPLTSNLENKGLLNITSTGTPQFDDNGKIGKAYNCTKVVTIPLTSLQGCTNFSIAYWLKIDSTASYNAYADMWNITMKVGNTSTTIRNELRDVSLPGVFGMHMGKDSTVGSNTNTYYNLGSRSDASDKWAHHCIVKDDNNVKQYINGNLVSTTACSNFESTPGYINGNLQLGMSGCYAWLNDFRIYDECISSKIIKEIANGLICHYKLCGTGGENLVSNSYNFSGWSIASGWTSSTDSDDGSTVYSFSRTGATSNNWARLIPTLKINPDDYPNGITVSLDIKTPDVSAINQKCIGSLQTYQESGSRIGWHEPIWDLSKVVNGQWTRISYYFSQSSLKTNNTSGTTLSYTQFSFQLVQNGDISIKKIKIEEGKQATPWCPNSSDTLYSTLGYDDGIEYDCSGYGNNGTKSGDITWCGDTTRYSGSYGFNGTNYIKTGFSATLNELTCSFWVKPNSSNGGYAIIASNYNNPSGGFWIAVNCESSGLWFYNGSYVKGNSILSNDTWYHGCFTYNNGIGKWYRNGELVTTSDISSKGTSLSISNLSIGNSYTGSSWNTKFYGNISDFRLYPVCLSDSDIKSLYDTSASIDKLGNMYSYEFKEEM